MTEREQFEKAFPVQEGVEWCDTLQHYIGTDNYNPDVWHAAREQDGRLRGWQAAKAGSAAQVEALQQQRRVLRGQLENCIGHLHAASRHGRREYFSEAIESANAAMTATEPKP